LKHKRCKLTWIKKHTQLFDTISGNGGAIFIIFKRLDCTKEPFLEY